MSKKEMAARPDTTATTSSNQHADGTATTTKSETILRHFVGGSSLNRFETERHHDHCLHSTVPSLAARFATAGHTLQRTAPQDGPVTYYAERRGLVRDLPTLDDARPLLVQIGGAA
jgi:hypothetical protein